MIRRRAAAAAASAGRLPTACAMGRAQADPLGVGRTGPIRGLAGCPWTVRRFRTASTRLAWSRGLFTAAAATATPKKQRSRTVKVVTILTVGGLVGLVLLYPWEERERLALVGGQPPWKTEAAAGAAAGGEKNAWFDFATAFENMSEVTDTMSDKLADMMLPDWSKLVPGYMRKLQRELSLAPGSLADEIWRDAHDPLVNPEVQFAATVRVSEDLCREEQAFRVHRQRATAAALARYLDLPAGETVDPEDVPVIALCGSGGGLRALVAGTGSLLAAAEAGLFDCVTYTGGVSGSCWLQALYFASFAGGRMDRVVDHLKARLGVHIASLPEAFALLTSAPTNKCLLSGVVEKLKGDPAATLGLVDVYGLLLAARLLVPKGELGVNEADFKLSNQRQHLRRGERPMPIYTAVRHEIPEDQTEAKATQADAQKNSWFQWFEITPYEFFCEEFAAGIPTWALGRKFFAGRDVPPEPGRYHLPETRTPLLLGIFGSAFCATLSHYYKEIRPAVTRLAGLKGFDEFVWGRNEDLSKVHPIDPAVLPNPIYGMAPESLPRTVPPGLPGREYIQLMDAGMSNNLPLYPFLRPGRGVEVVVVFDASADIRQDNWLSVADGYARQRGVKGWPIGVGWPQADASVQETAVALADAQADTTTEAQGRLAQAQAASTTASDDKDGSEAERARKTAQELGYCSVWVGSTTEKDTPVDGAAAAAPSPTPPLTDDTRWRLTDPDAGLTLIYLPYLANERRVPGVDPATSEHMSTWNFVYTPEQVDGAVALARANFEEGAAQIRATVRAVYERKKAQRLAAARNRQKTRYRRLVRLGLNDRLTGDDFS